MRWISIAAFAVHTFLCVSNAPAADLPDPAIPGLRYYYPPEKVEPRVIETDVCIYGATSGGVVAAVQASRMGKKAVLLEFGKHVGGLTTGGLSHTDGGSPSVCGGIAREFYNQVGQANFKPSDAERVYLDMLQAAGVEVHFLCHLDRVNMDRGRITSIVMENGLEVRARQYIDCTYEGDMMPKSGVSSTYGREANKQYQETYNGIRQLGTGGHDWPGRVDPYVISGDPSSGLLPRVFADCGTPGEGDQKIQAFCFRMRLVKDADRLPFPRPDVYDETQYELLARLFETGADPRPAFSIDTNNHHLYGGAYFIDFVGGNYGWPAGDWLERERIFQDHANYQIGVMYYLTHSDRIPAKWKAYFNQFGLPADEYQGTGGWTHQLYIREGRRMVSDFVMTQHHCQGKEVPQDSIGLASYNMDSHHCQMGVVDGAVRNEGNVEVPVNPYPVAYRAITPRQSECTNLLVPVALSSTHIAFGSIRMEPVFMILGQSAATAAAQAIDQGVPVQQINYDELKTRLVADKQILQYSGPLRQLNHVELDLSKLEGVVIDNKDATLVGGWTEGSTVRPFVADGYLHDGNQAKGELSARFEAKIKPGRYDIRICYAVNANRATNVPVTVYAADGAKERLLNQKKKPSIDGAFESIGQFELDGTAAVVISNKGTDGYVLVDAVQFVPQDEEEGDAKEGDAK
ncbi:MAG: FAD-dependent oxidoreductase [Planctomycetaceae bacterium]